MKKIITFFIFFLCAIMSYAQDTIYKRNKEVITAKISEIGLDEVKYKLWGYDNGPVVSVAKDNIIKIVFANGIVQYFTQEMVNPENYTDQRKNAVKVDFISPLRNNLSLGFERSIKPGRSMEFNVGIIGVGVGNKNWDEASGVFFRGGYKFIKSPDYYFRGMKYAHILKGGYVRPDFIIGKYKTTQFQDIYNPNFPYNILYTSTTKETITFGSLQLSLGKQWIYDDAFLIDIFGGVGYTFSDSDLNGAEGSVKYGVLGGGANTSFSVSGGFRVGFLFK